MRNIHIESVRVSDIICLEFYTQNVSRLSNSLYLYTVYYENCPNTFKTIRDLGGIDGKLLKLY